MGKWIICLVILLFIYSKDYLSIYYLFNDHKDTYDTFQQELWYHGHTHLSLSLNSIQHDTHVLSLFVNLT